MEIDDVKRKIIPKDKALSRIMLSLHINDFVPLDYIKYPPMSIPNRGQSLALTLLNTRLIFIGKISILIKEKRRTAPERV